MFLKTTAKGSGTNDGEDDLERGCPSVSSSRSSSVCSRGDLDAVIDVVISKKFVAAQNDDGSDNNNKPPRRLSQCSQLVSRRSRSNPLSTPPPPVTSTNKIVTTTATAKTTDIQLVPPTKSQLFSPSHHKSFSSQLRRRLSIAAIITSFVVVLFSGMFIRHQHVQISSLQSQIIDLNTRLHSSDVSLEQCRHVQKQMASAHESVDSTMGALRREYTEMKEMLVRCQEKDGSVE